MNCLGKLVVTVAMLAGSIVAAGSANADQATVKSPSAGEPRWSASIFGGFTDHDSQMFKAPKVGWDKSFREENIAGVALAYRAGRFWNHFTLEFEGGIGGRFPDSHAAEGWAAAFVRFDGFPWKHTLYTAIGASIGVDYVSKLPESELPTAEMPDRATSKLLHYFAPEIAFALPDHREHEVFARIHHRSGVWGLFNGVHGASDALVLGYRYRF